jgi:hypothetical protein
VPVILRVNAAAHCLLILLALLPAGCSAFESEISLRIALPDLPAHWGRAFPDMRARIIYADAAGRLREAAACPWGAPPVISCPKAGCTPVLAYPVTGKGGDGALRPAGALYPYSLRGDGQSLDLTWADGAASHVLLLLRRAGMDCSIFNGPRLRGYLGRHEDPWDLDLQEIARKIAQGDFTAYDIDALPARDQRVRPGTGQWFLESPFRPVVPADAQGVVVLRGLPDGLHALFSLEGETLDVSSGPFGVVVGSVVVSGTR